MPARRLVVGSFNPGKVAEVREALSTTRKWAVPLLNVLDAHGITRRRDDLRVAGPRLPT